LSHWLSDPNAKKMRVPGSWVCPAPSAGGYGNSMLPYPVFQINANRPRKKGAMRPHSAKLPIL